MAQINYRVTVRIGFNEFHKDFEYEQPALDCFDSIAVSNDTEVEGAMFTLSSDAKVDDVTIRRYAVETRLGDPTRR